MFRNLSLLWKFIIPFLALMLVAGALGAFFIVRDLSTRAERNLDQDLAARSLEARSRLKDLELYLLESVNFASNLSGMPEALVARDRTEIDVLLQSVLALKTDLDFLFVTDAAGRGVGGFAWEGKRPARLSDSALLSPARILVRRALERADKSSGFTTLGRQAAIAIAAPVCSQGGGCSPAGAVVAGIRAHDVVVAAARSAGSNVRGHAGAALYERSGAPVARLGRVDSGEPPALGDTGHVRRIGGEDRGELATLYSPYELRGKTVGTLAVSMPSAPAFASARDAAFRLALILLGVMAGLILIGLVLSRSFLGQVRPLLETNRALGAGELTARAPVLSNDELGELARGVNQMAEQLQAGYETLELRVDERTNEIRRLLNQRTEFFAAMSHEFRTPLAIILQQVDMLLDPSYSKDGGRGESGEAIRESAMQLLAAVNDILDLARAETGGLDIDLTEVSLNEVVSDLRHTIEGLARGGGLEVAIECPRDLPAVNADPTRLKEIIVNLVDNAIKYTPPGGTVKLAAGASNGVVELSVTDSGLGIPDEVGPQIFEPFYRVKGIEAQGGQRSSGLGLALTKRLVEAQGGEIRFTSEVGAGTTFTFTVPRVHSVSEKQD